MMNIYSHQGEYLCFERRLQINSAPYGTWFGLLCSLRRILPKTEGGGGNGGGEWEYRALVPRVLAPAILRILLTHNQSYWGNENLLPRTQESQTHVEMV